MFTVAGKLDRQSRSLKKYSTNLFHLMKKVCSSLVTKCYKLFVTKAFQWFYRVTFRSFLLRQSLHIPSSPPLSSSPCSPPSHQGALRTSPHQCLPVQCPGISRGLLETSGPLSQPGHRQRLQRPLLLSCLHPDS